MFGIYRIALAAPELRPAEVDFNRDRILEAYRAAVAAGASLALFPELAVTGASCGELFGQSFLLRHAARAAAELAAAAGAVPLIFGMPLLRRGALLNVMAWAQHGAVLGYTVRRTSEAPFYAGPLPPDADLHPGGTVFDCGMAVSLEFSGDFPADNRAELRLFAGAEALLPGAARRREERFRALSGFGGAAAAVFSGPGESGTDVFYGGEPVFAVNGRTVPGGAADDAPEVRFFDFDAEPASAARRKRPVAAGAEVTAAAIPEAPDLRFFADSAHPFLPDDPAERQDFCRETLDIQARALAARFARCGAKTLVLGISGGLDSTLALVAAAGCCRLLHLPAERIVAVTMPGFGTTGRTKNNALQLAELLGAAIREIPVSEACLRHFSDIGHDPARRDSTYENAQARERTQILMDVANQTGGIVVGTGDLSEIALGWCTYNGDHMAMYNVNAAIPKSSIAPLLECAAADLPSGAAAILNDVIATPVSPELLPPDADGNVGQKTEQILGAYELHDYFLFHLLSGVSDPEKLAALARHAFGEKYPEEEVIRVRELFFRRFFTQQFKRTAAPDGVQAGPFSLSARSAWRMGADLTGALWRS